MFALMDWILSDIGNRQSPFECEAELQLELALWFRFHIPKLDIQLEANVFQDDPSNRLDIAVSSTRTAIELKFAPKSTGPADRIRYGYIKDICRLEKLCKSPDWNEGYAIIVAERDDLWLESDPGNTDEEFQIYDGRFLSGDVRWSKRTSSNTRKELPSLHLDGTYFLKWRKFGDEGWMYCTALIL